MTIDFHKTAFFGWIIFLLISKSVGKEITIGFATISLGCFLLATEIIIKIINKILEKRIDEIFDVQIFYVTPGGTGDTTGKNWKNSVSLEEAFKKIKSSFKEKKKTCYELYISPSKIDEENDDDSDS